MLRAASELKNIAIAATDGEIGSVKDLYFDDMSWTVRYLVVDTGSWRPGRQVLISPHSVAGQPEADRIRVSLTREQVENSPPIDTDKPVNRQREISLSQYDQYPYDWEGPYRWGPVAYPGVPITPLPAGAMADQVVAGALDGGGDPHLRSVRDINEYSIAATDGDIGHVEDFVIDDRAWAIRYIIVDTGNWWPGKKVVTSPEWIQEVSWADSRVYVDLSREELNAAPEYVPGQPFERGYETRLFEHHNRRKYWERGAGG